MRVIESTADLEDAIVKALPADGTWYQNQLYVRRTPEGATEIKLSGSWKKIKNAEPVDPMSDQRQGRVRMESQR